MPEIITEITVIRHGQTAANLQGIIQGHSNTQLDETGLRQAACAAERLKDESFDILFCSDLDRTRTTADILLRKTHAAEIVYTPALREWNLGELEGKPVSFAKAQYPAIFASGCEVGSDICIKNGESRRDLYNRIARFLEETAAAHAGKKILLVTHAGPLRAMFRYVAGGVLPNTFTPRVDNVCYTRIRKAGNYWQLLCWNDTSHLKMMEN